MIDPFSIAALGTGLLKGGFSLMAGSEAATRKRRAVEEASRRLRLDHERTLSTTRAVGAASGVAFESASLQTYLTTMTDEFRKQEDFTRKAGLDEASALQDAAGINLFSDTLGSLFSFGARNNWFKSPAVK